MPITILHRPPAYDTAFNIIPRYLCIVISPTDMAALDRGKKTASYLNLVARNRTACVRYAETASGDVMSHMKVAEEGNGFLKFIPTDKK